MFIVIIVVISCYIPVANQMCSGLTREFLSPSKVRLTLAWGFPYEAFGASSTVKPWHVINLVESGRAFSFNRIPNLNPHQKEVFLCGSDLYTHHALFQGSARLTLSKQLYDLTLPKAPLTLEKELVYVGKSSINICTDVLLPLGSNPDTELLTLATCEVQSVLVNMEIRRPTPFPDWWKEKYGLYSNPERQLKVKVQQEPTSCDGKSLPQIPPSVDIPIPGGVSSYNLKVCYSDCDAYGHANWSVYLKYCLDALMLGTLNHDAKNYKHLQSRALKSADIAYISEGSVGQDIRVAFWKDLAIPGSVHFSIQDCATKTPITYAFLQFYCLDEVSVPVYKH